MEQSSLQQDSNATGTERTGEPGEEAREKGLVLQESDLKAP